MDLERLRIESPEKSQPYWIVGHIVYDDGPIVAVLWWANDEESRTVPLDDKGVVIPDVEVEPEDHWCYWIVGEYEPDYFDPREQAASVIGIASDISPEEALKTVANVLEGKPEPTMTRPESVKALEALWVETTED